MRVPLIVLGVSCWLAGSAFPAESRGRVSAIEENDVFWGEDRHYTQGLKLSYVTGSLNDRPFLDGPIRFLRERALLFWTRESDLDDRIEFTVVGQSLFTPDDTSLSNPDPDDRPYAGWLYTGLTLIQNAADRQFDTLELQIGVVGSYALGRQAQNDFHLFTEDPQAKGWGHQLANEVGIVLSWERKWRLSAELSGGFAVEFIPEVGISVGNVFTYGSVGGLVRIGRGLKTNWGPNLIRPAYAGTGYFAAERVEQIGFGFSLFAGVQGRVVGRNIFLDGNTFANSRSVDKDYLVADLYIGAELFYKDYVRLAVTSVTRTQEFEDQDSFDNFLSINLAVSF